MGPCDYTIEYIAYKTAIYHAIELLQQDKVAGGKNFIVSAQH